MIADNLETAVDRLRDLVADAGMILPFTGAGISTECCIPDFRSPGGFWTRNKPIQFDDFPVDVATASYRQLVRVPGVGVLTAKRLVAERNKTLIRDLSDLRKIGVQTTRATGFLALRGRKLGAGRWSEQLAFWGAGEEVGAHKQVYDVSPGTFR